jgi:hypothetical protein
MSKIRDVQRWEPWRLKAETLELAFDGRGHYAIPLDDITDAPNMGKIR